MIDLLNEAIKKIDDLPNKAPHKANIKGKWYTLVASRVSIFREVFGTDARIQTEVVTADLERVCMKATVYVRQQGVWEEVANAFAEEFRGAGMINKTSAIENCETSAIGRALSNLGLSGGEFASSFEVENAINNKAEAPNVAETYQTRYVILSDKGAKLSSYTDITKYVDALGLMMGKNAVAKDGDKANACYKQNRTTIKKVYSDLPDGDKHKALFNDLITAYENREN
jgi:hypothetical protein